MKPDQYAYAYILSNGFRKLYVGVTTEIEARVNEHKTKKHPRSFTAKYNINRLVYFERFSMISSAIVREKQLKSWLRKRKLELIISTNPGWRDLSEDWGKPMPSYQWPQADDAAQPQETAKD